MKKNWRRSFLRDLKRLCREYDVTLGWDREDGVVVRRADDDRYLYRVSVGTRWATGTHGRVRPPDPPSPYYDFTLTKVERIRGEIALLEQEGAPPK